MTARGGRRRRGPVGAPEDHEVPIRVDDLKQLRKLLAFLKPYKRRLAMAIGAVAVASAMGLVFPLVIGRLVDTALAESAAGDVASLNRIALFLLGVFAVQAIFNYVQQYQLAAVGEGVVADLRTRLYAHLMLLSVKFFESRKTGEITSRLTSDVGVVQGTVSQSVASVASQSLTLLGGVVMLFVISARLSATVLVILPLLIVAARFFGKRLERISMAFQDKVAEANSVAEEAIAGIRVVQWFGAEQVLVDRYSGSISDSYRLALRRARLRALFVPAVQFSVFATISLVLWFGGRLVLAGEITGGDLVTFLLYTFTVAGAIGTFTGLYSQLQEALGSTRRIFELLDEVSEVAEPTDPIDLPALEGTVTFHDVSFAYSDRAGEVLRAVDVEAAPGQVVALVGPSGVGKSTMVQLVARFFDPTSGRICVDGVDIRRIRLAQLRSHMAAVPQDTHLFSGTIAENIRMGKADADDDGVVAAAVAANADEFISGFPDGYQTVVGERGVKLSGGQRQRVAIARALLKDPRILILDEATSALDSESEAVVQDALSVLMKGRTTFVIAHRLSTVRNADRILVLDGGRIVEQGTHTELMAAGGLYADLAERQFTET
ncbi:MAG: ABC transporter ATP-binding protein [Acidimicrobiia bacterium]